MNQQILLKTVASSIRNDVDEVKQGLKDLRIIKEPEIVKGIHSTFLYMAEMISDNLFDNVETPGLMSTIFINAAANNNLDFCKYLVDSKELRIHVDINRLELWSGLISLNNLEAIKYFIDHPKIKNRGRLIVNALKNVEGTPKLEILKYLIDNPSMLHHQEVMDALNYFYFKVEEPENKTFSIFKNACCSGNKDWVQFFLEKKMVNRTSFLNGIDSACIFRRDDLLRYLLHPNTSPYKPYEDYNPVYFLTRALKQDAWDVVQVLIFDLGMKKPDDFFDFSCHESDRAILKKVESLFQKRQLNEELGNSLEIKPENKKMNRKI